jgi:hypothetical protein
LLPSVAFGDVCGCNCWRRILFITREEFYACFFEFFNNFFGALLMTPDDIIKTFGEDILR